MKKISALLVIIFAVLVFFLPQRVKASEGTVELRATNGENYRCWAASVYIFSNNRYKILIGCAELIYPPKFPELYKYYIVWSTPKAGKGPIRLGELGGGSGQYESNQAFSELFVSLENQNTVRTPSSNVVMRGTLQPIQYLLRASSPTPTPKSEIKPTGEEEKPQVETANLSTREKLVLALRRAGIAALIALVVIVGLIFVVSRSRG